MPVGAMPVGGPHRENWPALTAGRREMVRVALGGGGTGRVGVVSRLVPPRDAGRRPALLALLAVLGPALLAVFGGGGVD